MKLVFGNNPEGVSLTRESRGGAHRYSGLGFIRELRKSLQMTQSFISHGGNEDMFRKPKVTGIRERSAAVPGKGDPVSSLLLTPVTKKLIARAVFFWTQRPRTSDEVTRREGVLARSRIPGLRSQL